MQAIEFTGILKNGIVQIPAQYQPQWEGKTIRVILLEENESENIAHPISDAQKQPFSAVKLNTKGFKFDRDEANAR